MSRTGFTVEVYIRDARIRGKMTRGRIDWNSKNILGYRFLEAMDFQVDSEKEAEQLAKQAHKHRGLDKLRFEVHQTYVTRQNAMTGKDYQERYDTPTWCSPSTESYWSM